MRTLVRREPSDHDRRSHALILTEAGAELIAELKILSDEHEATVARPLSEDERATLMNLLERLHTPGPGRG